MTARRQHWESLYQRRSPTEVSWYQENPARSLILIEETGVATDDPIIDIGGGSSRLVDRLLDLGYTRLTVLDLAPTALAQARDRLGTRAADVVWIEADVLEHHFAHPFALWHDRAVFHFLTDPDEQAAYVTRLEAALRPSGHAIIATFSPDGPDQCSGLPVQRHSPESLSEVLGSAFEPVGFQEEAHHTPAGNLQHFLYGRFLRTDG